MKNSKQRLFEVMSKVDKSFNPKLDERYGSRYNSSYSRDRRFWSKEKNAGDPDAADPRGYYEVENGAFVDVSDYDKWEHGKIINRYNRNGKKVDEFGDEIGEAYGVPDPLGSNMAKQMNEKDLNEDIAAATQKPFAQQQAVPKSQQIQPSGVVKNPTANQQPSNLTLNNYLRQLYSFFKKIGAAPMIMGSGGMTTYSKDFTILLSLLNNGQKISIYVVNLKDPLKILNAYLPKILQQFPDLQVEGQPQASTDKNGSPTAWMTLIPKTTKKGATTVTEEDDKWIQKAVNPEHKGYCTPMTKPTCTPARKALAKRFKKGIDEEMELPMNEISADMAYRAYDAAKQKEIDSFDSPYHSKEEHEKAKRQADKFWYYGQGKDDEENPEELIQADKFLQGRDPEQQMNEKIIGTKPKGKRDDVAYYKGSGAFPGYTHFAVLKQNNKIINGWDYRGYDSEDLKMDKRSYFMDDIKDMQFDPKMVKVVTTKYLQKQGIDPFDFKYWLPNEEYKNFAIY